MIFKTAHRSNMTGINPSTACTYLSSSKVHLYHTTPITSMRMFMTLFMSPYRSKNELWISTELVSQNTFLSHLKMRQRGKITSPCGFLRPETVSWKSCQFLHYSPYRSIQFSNISFRKLIVFNCVNAIKLNDFTCLCLQSLRNFLAISCMKSIIFLADHDKNMQIM